MELWEVIVFPRDYEKYHHLMNTDAKVFIRGKATVEEVRTAS